MKPAKLQPKPLSCPHCGRNFVLDACLAAHKTIEHHDQAPHKCAVCKISFFSAQAYNDHILSHSVVRTSPSAYFKCSECSLEFPTEHGLRVHVSQHTGMTRGIPAKTSWKSQFMGCSFCPAVLAGKKRYREHLKIHETIRPYECEQCHVSFRLEAQLQVHKKRHLELKDLPPEAVKRYFAQIPGGSIKITQEGETN